MIYFVSTGECLGTFDFEDYLIGRKNLRKATFPFLTLRLLRIILYTASETIFMHSYYIYYSKCHPYSMIVHSYYIYYFQKCHPYSDCCAQFFYSVRFTSCPLI